jgi:hypothetical protein
MLKHTAQFYQFIPHYTFQLCEPEHHHHLPPWIRSLDLFWHHRVAIISWGFHDLFFL